MKTILKNSIALAAAALTFATATSHAQTAYALGDNGTALIKFDLATPAITTLVGPITGVGGRLDGIDFRPSNGLLYGYSFQTNGVFTINLNTAAATLAATPGTASTVGNLGIDFNPAADRLRLVNPLDQNLRINVGNGVTIPDGTLAFVAGDPNFGTSPSVNEVAYTNNDSDPATATQLFYIDPNLDILVNTINPNAGELRTVGALGFNASELTGFDIFTSLTGTNSAYALLTNPGGGASLHSINLATGAATAIGNIVPPAGIARPFSLAIQPVPEPGTALFGLAIVGTSFVRNRRRTAARA